VPNSTGAGIAPRTPHRMSLVLFVAVVSVTAGLGLAGSLQLSRPALAAPGTVHALEARSPVLPTNGAAVSGPNPDGKGPSHPFAPPPIVPYVNSTYVLFNSSKVAGNFQAADPQGPDGMAVDTAHSELYVANQYTNLGNFVSVISTTNNSTVATVPVGGNPTDVAYDPAMGEMFVTDSGSARVSVINDSTNQVVATIRVGAVPEGVAYDNRSGDLFVTNAGSNNVTVIDGYNNSKVAAINLPPNPYVGDYPVGVVYDGNTNEVFVADYYYYGISVLNATNLSLITTISTTGAPWYLAYDSGRGEIYATNPYNGHLTVISDKNLSLVTTIPVSSSVGVGYDPAKGQILATAYPNRVELINDTRNVVVASNPAGGYSPWYIVYDPSNHRGYVACTGSATVAVLSASNNVTGSILLGSSPAAIAYDSAKAELFVANTESDEVLVVSDTSGRLLATVPVGIQQLANPGEAVYDNGTGQVFVANYESDDVSVISDSTDSVTATVAVGGAPSALAYDNRDHRIFVAAGHNVSAISDATDKVVASLTLPGDPGPLAYDSGTNQVFAANSLDNNVSVVNASSDTLNTTIPVGHPAQSVAYAGTSGDVYVAGGGNLSVIADSNDSVLGSHGIGAPSDYDSSLALDRGASELFVSESGTDNVTAISTTNLNSTFQLPVGADVTSVTYDSGAGFVFTTNENGGTLSQIQMGSLVQYSVVFNESGLPNGTNWSVSLAGGAAFSVNSTIAFLVSNGSYGFAVGNTPTYDPTPAGGTVTVNGANVTVPVNFSFVQNYNVTIAELGLPRGTPWQVTLDGIVHTASSPQILALLSNGTYSYRVGAVVGFSASPSFGVVSVVGMAVNLTVNFTAIVYNVTFSEGGLPPATLWSVTLNNSTTSGTGSLTFGVTDGTYVYTVASQTGYTVSPSGGSVNVAGANQTVQISFRAIEYSVTFEEFGLGPSTPWSVTFNGSLQSSSSSTDIFPAIDGDYSFSVSPITGYAVAPASGSVPVFGANVSVQVNFTKISYTVSFSETGLPSSTNWSVVLNGTTLSAKSPDINFTVTDGTYLYSVVAPAQYSAQVPQGSVTVDGSNATVSVLFVRLTYSVTFSEAGLPAGARWGVTLDSSEQNGTGTNLTFSETSGNFSYAVHSPAGFVAGTPQGTVTVTNRNVTVVVTFGVAVYSVQFVEAGLPPRTNWSVTLDSVTRSSTNSTVQFLEENGSLPFLVNAVPGYVANVTGGNLEVSGSAIRVEIGFRSTVVPTYDVNFSESGLSSGTLWSVTLNGTGESSTGSLITFVVPNGSYNFSVGRIKGYSPSVSAGRLNVSGGPVPYQITFAAIVPPTYLVTFNESGLLPGTEWSVTVNRTVASSNTSSIQLREPNGTYAFTVAAIPGYASPLGGEVVVQGSAAHESLQFYFTGSSSSPAPNDGLYIGLGVASTVVVILAIALLARRGRRPAPVSEPGSPPGP
jgi:YVTN family beta-propeller protein